MAINRSPSDFPLGYLGVSSSAGYSELLGDRNGPRRPAVHVVCDLEPPSEGVTLLTHQELAKVFKAGAVS